MERQLSVTTKNNYKYTTAAPLNLQVWSQGALLAKDTSNPPPASPHW